MVAIIFLGIVGKVEVDECYSIDERIYFKSTDYDELIEKEDEIVFELSITDKELRKYDSWFLKKYRNPFWTAPCKAESRNKKNY